MELIQPPSTQMSTPCREGRCGDCAGLKRGKVCEHRCHYEPGLLSAPPPRDASPWWLVLRDESDHQDIRWLLVLVVSAEPATASKTPPLGWMRSKVGGISATAVPLFVPMPAWRVES